MERKIMYDFAYDMETKMKFHVSGERNQEFSRQKFLALSKNVSTEGLCFVSEKKLEKGVYLNLEIYLPGEKDRIRMEGEVKWCAHVSAKDGGQEQKQQFDTGVKLVSIEGRSVRESVYFDDTYQVEWSTVLESILGKYRILMQKKR